jgi:hypothetical protein
LRHIPGDHNIQLQAFKVREEFIFIFGHNPLSYNMADRETKEVRDVPIFSE